MPTNYYALLQVSPWASSQEIRRSYRELSKLYHPDTTRLPAAIAVEKFQELNQAYATLNDSQQRMLYDQKLGLRRIAQTPPIPKPVAPPPTAAASRVADAPSAYLSAFDRPLSAGEIFALFILGLTLIACLGLAIVVGFARGEIVIQPPDSQEVVQAEGSIPTVPQASPPLPPETGVPVLPADSDALGTAVPSGNADALVASEPPVSTDSATLDASASVDAPVFPLTTSEPSSDSYDPSLS